MRLILTTYFCLVLLLAFTPAYANSDVSNLTVEQVGQQIVIEYDLSEKNDITAYVSVNSSSYVELLYVEGDYGADIEQGHHKLIWNVLKQFDNFDFTEVKFKVEAGYKSVKDICGNFYKVVKIGEQYWMAENLKCNRFDTGSEAYSDGRRKIHKSLNYTMEPYYTDATDKNNWTSRDYSKELSSKDISSLGFLYNWAAAVGIVNGLNRKDEYPINRQGICPNGWHLPSKQEFKTLIDSLGGDNASATKLKTSSGWYGYQEERSCNGIDMYGFSALPSGHAYGERAVNVGFYSYFWTSSPVSNAVGNAYSCFLQFKATISSVEKYYGHSVRCVKN